MIIMTLFTLVLYIIPANQAQQIPPTARAWDWKPGETIQDPGGSNIEGEPYRGYLVYLANGCTYCHSLYLRPEDIKTGWAEGARPDEVSQMAMLDLIVREGLSVRETEERVRALVAPVAAAGSGAGAGGNPAVPGQQLEAPTEVGLFTLSGGLAAGRRGRSQLEQVSDRRAIRAFRDVRLFLNTFRRAVEMLREAGVRAEMVESDGPDYLEIKVLIPKDSAVRGGGVRSSGSRPVGPGRGAGKRGPAT
ncbi:MAG: hypothetical protein K6U08_07375 [Firmicutes bacterium]|nr:hypothetical protein [Bacillota bacterium]